MRPLVLVMFAACATAQPPLQYADLGDFRLTGGEILRGCRIAYRTFGQLNADRSNAILFPTWFSGTTADLLEWIGPGKLADSNRYFVVAVDALANGASTSPSNGQQPFPQVSIRDMVNSQYELATKHLGLKRLHAVMGISMGGMQTFEWMTAYPDFMSKAVPIIGSPRLSAPDLLLWQAELDAIEAAGKCNCDPGPAMQAVSLIHAFALTTPEHRRRTLPAAEFQKFRATQVIKMDPRDWAAQLRAMIGHDVGRGFGGSLEKAARSVRAKTLVVAATQDHMVNPATAIGFGKMLGGRTLELTGDCGHIAISCEQDKLVAAVAEFLRN